MRTVLRRVYPILNLTRSVYRRVFRPSTHGVRVVICGSDTGDVLLVRHCYGRRDLWYPPGGGYNPARESAADAGRREVREEVGLVLGAMRELGSYRNTARGQDDTVQLFLASTEQTEMRLSAEIAEHRWFAPDELADAQLAGITRQALARVPHFEKTSDNRTIDQP